MIFIGLYFVGNGFSAFSKSNIHNTSNNQQPKSNPAIQIIING